jgi:hypothetical protein
MIQAIITALKALKLHGMAAHYPEVAAQARHTEFSPEAFLGQLLRAEQAERTEARPAQRKPELADLSTSAALVLATLPAAAGAGGGRRLE